MGPVGFNYCLVGDNIYQQCLDPRGLCTEMSFNFLVNLIYIRKCIALAKINFSRLKIFTVARYPSVLLAFG